MGRLTSRRTNLCEGGGRSMIKRGGEDKSATIVFSLLSLSLRSTRQIFDLGITPSLPLFIFFYPVFLAVDFAVNM